MIRRQMTARIRFGNIDKGIRNREIDMKNKNKKHSLLYILAGGIIPGAFLGSVLIGMPVSANSSWVWISQTRPYDVLPWVALVTIIIETICLKRVLKEQRWKKVLVVTLVATFCPLQRLMYFIRLTRFSSGVEEIGEAFIYTPWAPFIY